MRQYIFSSAVSFFSLDSYWYALCYSCNY